jgi:hypothetical protein
MKVEFEIITPDNPSESSKYIIGEILPDWVNHFLSKNVDYGDQHREIGLGEIGEFVGIWRKLYKLKRAIVDKQPMQNENVDEMLYDLIGQCFLLLDIRRGNFPRSGDVTR